MGALSLASFACGAPSNANVTPVDGGGGTGVSDAGGAGQRGANAAAGAGGLPAVDASAGEASGAMDVSAETPRDAGPVEMARDVPAETPPDAGPAELPGTPLPPGVPTGYKLLLDEPFTSPGSLSAILAGNPADWTHVADDGGSLQYGGVGYTPPNPPIPESFTSFAIVRAMKLGGFVLEVELMQRNPQQGIPQRDMCIVFGAESETRHYYAHIAEGHTDRWHNIHLIADAPRRPITKTNNGGIRWGANQWHKVRVVRDLATGEIAVYMDGNLAAPILTATDTTLGEGYVGFAAHQDSGSVRNLKVWGASATAQAAPGNFFR
jgi:hypothetical protein